MNQEDKFLVLVTLPLDRYPLGKFKSLYEKIECHRELFTFIFSSLPVEKKAGSFCQLSEHIEKIDLWARKASLRPGIILFMEVRKLDIFERAFKSFYFVLF